jgi:CTP:molybdopterin cytidylyltransferase MocA
LSALRLFQLIGDLVDRGLGASLVAVGARSAADADRPDHLVADSDWQPATEDDDAADVLEACEARIASSLSDLTANSLILLRSHILLL